MGFFCGALIRFLSLHACAVFFDGGYSYESPFWWLFLNLEDLQAHEIPHTAELHHEALV